ncbi:MAG: trypsin-like peptidase domain-containing protein [Chthoniobacterales bacterium]
MKNYFLVALLAFLITGAEAATPTDIRNSVVRIMSASQFPNYGLPWEPGQFSGGSGSGFVISGNRILTNAHVVSNSRFITVSRQNDPRPWPARVLFIAHDCDLALLEVEDSSFFKKSFPLEIGGVPEIESTVSVYGYPIGGDRLSVTRGIVSRIDFQLYSHSAADQHLTIQIDAAINPGNSGGPVLQDGKVVGVAFQGYSGDVAQNVGYMIPTPVINHFLEDISTGSYNNYVDIALTYFPLLNDATRQGLGLKDEDGGVLVGTVYGDGSADGHIESGDVLLAIDGVKIARDGTVDFENDNIELAEIIERKFKGDNVTIDLLRNGEKKQVHFPLKSFPHHIYANRYDEKPRYLIFAGLVFQPVNRNFVQSYHVDNFLLKYLYARYLNDDYYRDHPDLITLSQILADPVNSYAESFIFKVVESVNDTPIKTMQDLADAFEKAEEFYVIRFLGEKRPLVIEAKAARAAHTRILENYSIKPAENL